MSKKAIDIINLADLDKLRSAPRLSNQQSKKLFREVEQIVSKADWLTIGVMSPTIDRGLNAVRDIEERFKLNKMRCVTLPTATGPIFLKANQKTGEIHARIEHGLGEGILISFHYNDNPLLARTVGPFPLNFFE